MFWCYFLIIILWRLCLGFAPFSSCYRDFSLKLALQGSDVDFTSLTVLIESYSGFASSTSFDNTDMDDIQVWQSYPKAGPFVFIYENTPLQFKIMSNFAYNFTLYLN